MDKLLKQIAELKQIELTDEVVELSQKKIADMRLKANEVMHTTNTGYGKELIPVNVLTDTVLDMIPQYMGILNAFNVGFHGNQMGTSDKVAITGEVGFAIGNSEWTTGAGAIAQGTHRLPTDEVTITQYNLQVSVDVSNAELAYSVEDLNAKLLREISKSMVRTAESAIVNADPNTSTAGNINSFDQAAATTFATTGGAADHRLLGWTGLRKTALAGTANISNFDLGTLTMADYFTLIGSMGVYSTSLQDLVLIEDNKAYYATLGLDTFANYNQNGRASTAITGALQNVAGIDMFMHRDLPATGANGSHYALTTNTKGTILAVRRPAVQRGYGKNGLDITAYKIPGKGYSFVATMDFGFAIADQKADVTDPSVVIGYNIS